ncbi:MAG: nuclear transport factor 2 family protein [Actinomycetota bacterium]
MGRDVITAVAASFYEALPDMQVYFDDLVVDRDRIEYHWTFTGTNSGPGGTSNAVRMKGFESWTIDEDGLIAASIGSYDAWQFCWTSPRSKGGTSHRPCAALIRPPPTGVRTPREAVW